MTKKERNKAVWQLGKDLDIWMRLNNGDLLKSAQAVFPAITRDANPSTMTQLEREQCLKLLVMDRAEKMI